MNLSFRLIVVLWIAAAQPARSQPLVELPTDQVEEVEKLVTTEMSRQKIPGMSVAIAVKGRLVYAQGFGLADLENSVPVRADSVFRTASIAKPLTAVGVMRLVESGRLDLDKPVRTYCEEFPEKKWPVTSRHLLAHLGGVRHYKSSDEAAGKQHFFSLRDSLALFKDEPLIHEPGTKFLYTTYGYSILGRVIEEVSGQAYATFMKNEVFTPAAMTQTQLDYTFELIPGRVRGYRRVDLRLYSRLSAEQRRRLRIGQIVGAELHDTSMKVPGGGLVSTSSNLVRFGLAMQQAKLLKKETVAAMWTEQKSSDGKSTNYGLGWQLSPWKGHARIAHSGGQAGTATQLAIFPDQDCIVAAMCNLQRVRLADFTGRVSQAVAGGEASNQDKKKEQAH